MDNPIAYGRFTPGVIIMGIGAVHQLAGVVAGLGLLPSLLPFPGRTPQAPLLDLWRSGVVGQAEADPLRMAMAWYLLFGFLLIFSGAVLQRLELSGGKLSRGLAWGLGGLCALGVVLIPVSGFWLGFIPAIQIWRRVARHVTKP